MYVPILQQPTRCHSYTPGLPQATNIRTAPECRQLDRPLCSLSPVASFRRSQGGKIPYPPQIRHPHPLTQLHHLPDCDDPPFILCRPVQYSPSPPYRHNPSVPAALDHSPTWRNEGTDRSTRSPKRQVTKSHCLHAIDYSLHQPSLPCPRSNSMLRPRGIH